MKLRPVFLALVMVTSSVVATPVFARSVTEPKAPVEKAKASTGSAPAAKDQAAPNAKLKGDMQKLLTDAKAGKVAPRAQQFPNTRRNNLSTGAKIGIIAAIAGVIFVLIVLHQVNSD